MLIELTKQFPEHEFEMAESNMDDLESSILPIATSSTSENTRRRPRTR